MCTSRALHPDQARVDSKSCPYIQEEEGQNTSRVIAHTDEQKQLSVTREAASASPARTRKHHHGKRGYQNERDYHEDALVGHRGSVSVILVTIALQQESPPSATENSIDLTDTLRLLSPSLTSPSMP